MTGFLGLIVCMYFTKFFNFIIGNIKIGLSSPTDNHDAIAEAIEGLNKILVAYLITPFLVKLYYA